MKFSFTYQYRLLLRVFITLGCGFLCFFVFLETDFWLLGVLLAVITTIMTFFLYRFLLTAERELDNFLTAVKQNDFTTGFPSTRFILGEKIPGAFKMISEEFQKIRGEKESEHALLTTIVAHMGFPIICYYTDNGKTSIYNKAAQEMLNRPFIQNISALEKVNTTIYRSVTSIRPGTRDLIKVVVNNVVRQLSVHAIEILMQGKNLRIVSLQDIKTELDEQEIISWQRLIRVLTHEIKNSAIPIATMSDVLYNMISEKENGLIFLDPTTSKTVEKGIYTIKKRSKNLASFIEGYDRLTKLPKPQIESVNLKELTKSILELLTADLLTKKINYNIKIQGKAIVETDPRILEQILINLVKNSIESFDGTDKKRNISVIIDSSTEHIRIDVEDNGQGIPEEIRENIFVPFFTTKENGSGIGLGLSRQLLRTIGGTINFTTNEEGTRFSIVL